MWSKQYTNTVSVYSFPPSILCACVLSRNLLQVLEFTDKVCKRLLSLRYIHQSWHVHLFECEKLSLKVKEKSLQSLIENLSITFHLTVLGFTHIRMLVAVFYSSLSVLWRLYKHDHMNSGIVLLMFLANKRKDVSGFILTIQSFVYSDRHLWVSLFH